VRVARRLLSALWPLLLLAVFIGTFRRAPGNADTASTPANCEDVLARADFSATDRFERCLALDDMNPAPLVDLGRAAQSAGRPADAERLYRRALDLDPSDSDVHVRLGELLLERGDAPAARAEAEAALRWRPNGAAAMRLLERAGAASRPRS
jgi:Flp pilus assembly protein TadD